MACCAQLFSHCIWTVDAFQASSLDAVGKKAGRAQGIGLLQIVNSESILRFIRDFARNRINTPEKLSPRGQFWLSGEQAEQDNCCRQQRLLSRSTPHLEMSSLCWCACSIVEQ
eukprot:5728228-Amphidinium_carterae.2